MMARNGNFSLFLLLLLHSHSRSDLIIEAEVCWSRATLKFNYIFFLLLHSVKVTTNDDKTTGNFFLYFHREEENSDSSSESERTRPNRTALAEEEKWQKRTVKSHGQSLILLNTIFIKNVDHRVLYQVRPNRKKNSFRLSLLRDA